MEDIYSRSNSGFSLTELLMSIAIIFILAAILLPLFAHLRDSRHYWPSQSSARRLGLGRTKYTERNETNLPRFPHNKSYR